MLNRCALFRKLVKFEMASKNGNSSATADNSNELKLEIGLLSNVQTFSAVFNRIFLKVVSVEPRTYLTS